MTLDSGATCTGVDAQGNKVYSYNHGKIFSGNHNSLSSTSAGFYLSKDGLSIGSKFSVDDDGILNATNVNLSGVINVSGTGGSKIGNWMVNEDNLYGSHRASNNLWYDITIGSNGNLFARQWASGVTPHVPATEDVDYTTLWSINSDGTVNFKNLTANVAGLLGGWTIDGNKLYSGTLKLNGGSSPSIEVGSDVTLTPADGIVANKGKFGNAFDISTNSFGNANVSMANLNSGTIQLNNSTIKLTGSTGEIICKKITIPSGGSIQIDSKDVALKGTTYSITMSGTADLQTGAWSGSTTLTL